MSSDHKSQPTTKFSAGLMVILFSIIALVALLVAGASDRIGRAVISAELRWSLIAIFAVFLSVGILWVVKGIRAVFLPTSLLYRVTDLPSLFERFTRGR